MTDVVLVAPLAGWLTPLEEVPDPVFAERMMGEGVAIDPVETILRAPADGMVMAIPETAHAVTLRLENGAEILIHVGLETVALGGDGFRAVSSAGARVTAGDPLIELDLDRIARSARSLVTPIIAASEGSAFVSQALSRKVAAGEPIGRVSTQAPTAAVSSGSNHERSVRIDAAHGLHARPAARIAALLRPFDAEVTLARGGQLANARSTVAMLGLGVRQGDELRIAASGADAEAAVDAVADFIAAGLGEAAAPLPLAQARGGPVCASSGFAVGRVAQFRLADLSVPRDGQGVAEERKALRQALDAVAASLTATGVVAAELAEAHHTLLSDPELLADTDGQIADGRSAAFAWRSACEAARERIRATGNALLIERAADLADLERRVIALLVGEAEPAAPDIPPDTILIAPDLLPSQFLALDKSRLAGICTAEGGPTSHVAILAASAGIPMMVGAGASVLDIADGTTAILDADHARIESDASPERLAEAQADLAERRARRAAEVQDARELCFTADGVRIEVFANLASVEDAHAAVAAGAEGCGLLRTEFLFLDRETPPEQDEQQRIYGEIAATLGGRPLILRTLDIGADKNVPYVALGREDNPALGLRGVRLSFTRPDLLETQLNAIVAAVPQEQCRVMLPMVTEVDELRQVRRLLDAATQAAGRAYRIPLGVMIETPASAVLADSIAEEADFLSVGTNDLTQYVLAADRGNAAVSARADGLHPAVLRLISLAAEGAGQHGRWIGVCGGIASDPIAAPILLGLGVTELSVAPAAVPAVKAAIRKSRMENCRRLAERACAAASAQEVRIMAAEAFQ
ncbi:MAG TPA: phosphoenolpyruvate--protein phosphotransferase [Sphingomicrobium sp.]|nr:phosphoenolpyruvate--protein phosphotransferase [Sphingomicrobium sp.]